MSKEEINKSQYNYPHFRPDSWSNDSRAGSVPVIVACEQVMLRFDAQRLEQMINCIKQRTEIT